MLELDHLIPIYFQPYFSYLIFDDERQKYRMFQKKKTNFTVNGI